MGSWCRFSTVGWVQAQVLIPAVGGSASDRRPAMAVTSSGPRGSGAPHLRPIERGPDPRLTLGTERIAEPDMFELFDWAKVSSIRYWATSAIRSDTGRCPSAAETL